jgi:hypothetical protein
MTSSWSLSARSPLPTLSWGQRLSNTRLAYFYRTPVLGDPLGGNDDATVKLQNAPAVARHLHLHTASTNSKFCLYTHRSCAVLSNSYTHCLLFLCIPPILTLALTARPKSKVAAAVVRVHKAEACTSPLPTCCYISSTCPAPSVFFCPSASRHISTPARLHAAQSIWH